MSARQTNTVEIQFSDGDWFRVETQYADSARALAKKLVQNPMVVRGKPWIIGTGVFKNYEHLVCRFGEFNPEKQEFYVRDESTIEEQA